MSFAEIIDIGDRRMIDIYARRYLCNTDRYTIRDMQPARVNTNKHDGEHHGGPYLAFTDFVEDPEMPQHMILFIPARQAWFTLHKDLITGIGGDELRELIDATTGE